MLSCRRRRSTNICGTADSKINELFSSGGMTAIFSDLELENRGFGYPGNVVTIQDYQNSDNIVLQTTHLIFI